MQKDGLLSIGELAGICDVSVKTLRFYDETGLITPVYVNPENNYRYYSTWQINRILTIKELKKIGFTLDVIRECMDADGINFDLVRLENILDAKENEIIHQLGQLKKQKEYI